MAHPEMTRLLIADRQRDMLARAEAQRKIRFVRRLRKEQAAAPAETVAIPRIPDYVDGSFRTEATEATEVPADAANPSVPAARNAA